MQLDISDKCNAYFITRYITETITTQAKSKRLEGIIYINQNLSEKLFDNLFKIVSSLPKMENMVLIDDPIFQPLSNFYPLFEEVIFFPTIRKVKILECQILKPFEDEKESETLKLLKEAKARREKMELCSMDTKALQNDLDPVAPKTKAKTARTVDLSI